MTTKQLTDEFLDLLGDAAADSRIQGWLSTGNPHFNKILSGSYRGGFAYGRLYEIFGPSASGKTVIATNAMIQAQKAGGIAILVDFEHAFMLDLAVSIGLDESKFVAIRPKTWEEGMTKMMQVAELLRAGNARVKAVPMDKPIILVVDSIAAAVPRSVLAKELTELTMNDTTALARATSAALKVVAARASEFNFTGVFLNQIREKPGVMFGDPTTTPGGKAMEYFSSGRLSLSRQQLTKMVDGKKKVIGAHITAKCVKSKHTRPCKTASVDFLEPDDKHMTDWFDIAGSLIDHLLELDLLEKSGTMIVWEGKKYQRGSLCKLLDNDKGIADLTALLPEDAEVV